jgi:hypothetical protein
MTVQGRFSHSFALALGFAAVALVAGRGAAATTDTERPAIDAVLERSTLLSDPFAASGEATFGARRVTPTLHAGTPQVRVTYGTVDASGRPAEAIVAVQLWITGTLEIREGDARGRDHVVTKDVRDSCIRQLTLRRVGTADDPLASRWRVMVVSPWVGLTPRGTASLPLVNLNTNAVSGGFLSVFSDLDELAVYPQTCAVTAPGDSVRVLVGGLETDAMVCVFADGQRVVARRSDSSHAQAMVALDRTGLAQIGVTVYSGRTLSDASAPADSRTWVLPIMVGPPPPRSQEWFAL